MLFLNSITSTRKSTTAGVPFGSVLGPLLFLIYVNDISENLLSLARHFSDDSSLFFSASNIRYIEGILNHDLILLSVWARRWFVNFNLYKTKAMLFSYLQGLINLTLANFTRASNQSKIKINV